MKQSFVAKCPCGSKAETRIEENGKSTFVIIRCAIGCGMVQSSIKRVTLQPSRAYGNFKLALPAKSDVYDVLFDWNTERTNDLTSYIRRYAS